MPAADRALHDVAGARVGDLRGDGQQVLERGAVLGCARGLLGLGDRQAGEAGDRDQAVDRVVGGPHAGNRLVDAEDADGLAVVVAHDDEVHVLGVVGVRAAAGAVAGGV